MFFSAELKMLFGAGIVLLVLGAFGTLLVMRANLKTELAEVTGREVLCQSVNQAWAEQAELQKKAMLVMKQEGEARAARVLVAEAAALKESSVRVRLAELLAKSKPRQEGCAALESLLLDYREQSR